MSKTKWKRAYMLCEQDNFTIQEVQYCILDDLGEKPDEHIVLLHYPTLERIVSETWARNFLFPTKKKARERALEYCRGRLSDTRAENRQLQIRLENNTAYIAELLKKEKALKRALR